MNVDSAWQLASGYSLIGQIDMGVYEAHPALSQFNGNNDYVGGNLVKIASKDVGLTARVDQPLFDSTNVDEGKAMRSACALG